MPAGFSTGGGEAQSPIGRKKSGIEANACGLFDTRHPTPDTLLWGFQVQ
jgi:hypothetical protein